MDQAGVRARPRTLGERSALSGQSETSAAHVTRGGPGLRTTAAVPAGLRAAWPGLLQRRWVAIACALAALVVASTFADFGVSWDEGVQAHYGELCLRYWSSAGADASHASYQDPALLRSRPRDSARALLLALARVALPRASPRARPARDRAGARARRVRAEARRRDDRAPRRARAAGLAALGRPRPQQLEGRPVRAGDRALRVEPLSAARRAPAGVGAGDRDRSSRRGSPWRSGPAACPCSRSSSSPPRSSRTGWRRFRGTGRRGGRSACAWSPSSRSAGR